MTDPKPGESNKSIKENDPSTEGGDAWEAAQHILKAINFGSLQSQTTSEAPSSHAPPPPPTTALSGIDLLSSLGIVLPSDDEPARSALTEEERASLQAQLALLAAQLSEIADLEDDEGNATDEEDPRDHTVGVQSSTEVTIETRPPAIPAPPVPVNDPMQDDEDEDEDEDDMEMVEVPTLPVETRT